MKKKKSYYVERIAAIIAALILLQTLYYKFTAHPDSVHIFSEIGGEPYMRIGSGVMELIIGILLLYRKTSFYGAILGLGVMLGAIGMHLFVIGVSVNNDGGALFSLAVVTFICCLAVIFLKCETILGFLDKK